MAEPTLIARLEAAKVGSRELDAAIAVAIKHELPSPMGGCSAYLRLPDIADECASGTYWLVQISGMSLRTSPAFTTSVDDALRYVVPEGWIITDLKQQIHNGCWFWACQLSRVGIAGTAYVGFNDGGHPTTFPLALCIVGLEARESG